VSQLIILKIIFYYLSIEIVKMSGRDRDKYRSHPSGHKKRLKKQAAEKN